MTKTRAAVAALLLAASTVALSATAFAADKAPTLSPRVAEQLQAAQKAVGAKDYQTALAATKKAQEATSRTDYDNLMIDQFLTVININLGDTAAAAAAAAEAADLPNIPDASKADIYKNATVLAINSKQYDKAVKYGKLLQALNLPDPQVQSILGQAYFLGGDFEGAKALAQKQIDAAIAVGQRPDHNALEIVLSSQANQKDEAGAEETLEKLIAYYNDPHDWQQMIDIALSSRGLRDIDAIYLGRLLFALGVPVTQQNANLIGQTASHLTFFGDAVNSQDHGGTGFPDAKPRAEADKKTIPAQITAGQKQNGQYNIKLAQALYSYAMYPQAEAAARLAIQKGGATDASEPPMVLGMTLVAEAKYDESITTLGQVMGGSPAMPRIVRLWVDFAKNKQNPPAPVTAAATPAPAPAAAAK